MTKKPILKNFLIAFLGVNAVFLAIFVIIGFFNIWYNLVVWIFTKSMREYLNFNITLIIGVLWLFFGVPVGVIAGIVYAILE